ncbi:hypothetical protein CSQ94_27825 [Janthinobacterium sp. BJB312]|nr:hypothetical protein CSQ94_27825 [Janthinobacterium sp. BJB312]
MVPSKKKAEKQIDITWRRETWKWAFTILCKITKNWFFIFRAKKNNEIRRIIFYSWTNIN